MNVEFLYGILNLSFWSYVVVTFLMVQFTFMGVTLYLHRDATHRSLDLHPALRHVFRFWLWMTSGIVTKEWVAVHRKHHARCETPEDPHSPVIVGLKKVLLEGAELYQAAARDPQVTEKFGRGTPDDWMERNVYSKYRNMGIVLLIVTDLVLFGVPGIIIMAAQLMANPLLAAGVVNGVGHYYGYRNFECADAARNVMPWGFLLAGEELHNNHHAFPSSAKFSVQRWEFDIGWLYIRIFKALGLARVLRTAPEPVKVEPRMHIDLENVRAVIVNRMHVLRDYTRNVTLPGVPRRAEQCRRCVEQPSPQAAGSRAGVAGHECKVAVERSTGVQSDAQDGPRIPRAPRGDVERREHEQRKAHPAPEGTDRPGRSQPHQSATRLRQHPAQLRHATPAGVIWSSIRTKAKAHRRWAFAKQKTLLSGPPPAGKLLT